MALGSVAGKAKLAPYGAAARDTLQAMGLLSALQPRLVQPR